MPIQPFFISDTHFGHKNILKHADRPFADIHEHDAKLMRTWNETIGPSDDVYHLGDFMFYGKPEDLIPHLNGRIHLIFGNHDKRLRKAKYADLFASTHDYLELKVGVKGEHQLVVLCHYPIESWNKRHYGSWHLHGHCHGSLPSPAWQRRVDMGVDVWNYRPVPYAEVATHMAAKTFKAIDHRRS